MKPTKKMPETWAVALGHRICTIRGEMGWSQDALATSANIDRSQLSEIENGLAEAKIGTIRAIAAAFGITVSELVMNIPGFD